MGRIVVLTDADRRIRKKELEALEEYEEEKRREAKKNHNFVQLDRNPIDDLIRLISENSLAARLLLLFAKYMSRQNVLILKFKDMQQITGLSRSSLAKAVKQLATEKWIQIEKVGAANKYTINASVFWTSSADLKKLSFGSRIVPVVKPKKDGVGAQPKKWNDVRAQFVPVLQQRGRKKREF